MHLFLLQALSAGTACRIVFNPPHPIWVKLFAFPCHHQEASGLVVAFWHFLHLLITPCGHYCNISLFHLREAESFLISTVMGVIINLSFSLLCHRLFVFCFQAQSLINHFLLDYANGINSVELFLLLLQAFSGFLLRADISFVEMSLSSGVGEWGGGISEVRVASLLLREGCSCPDLPLLEAVTKMGCKSQVYQPDPQCCGLAFGVKVWRGEENLFQHSSILKLLFRNSLWFLLMCSF